MEPVNQPVREVPVFKRKSRARQAQTHTVPRFYGIAGSVIAVPGHLAVCQLI